jgi:drug/metabolite transporter (DMT)-like permease
MGVILGLAAALLYGGSDFAGGLTSRKLGALPVNVVGSSVAAALAWMALLAAGGPGPTVHAVAWGLASGLGGGIGTTMLYRGLARGQMSVVGPVSAVAAAGVPVAAGIAMGERPTVLALAGVLVALPAIVLVAASGPASGSASGSASDSASGSASGLARGMTGSGLTDGLAAGAAFGFMFIGLAQAGHVPGGQGAGLWPVASEQTGSLLLVLAIALMSRVPLRPAIRAAGWPALVGASGMSATLLYFYATHVSMLATAAVLVSLYPGVTVLLARFVLHERFGPVQRAGLSLCTLAVVAIALN